MTPQGADEIAMDEGNQAAAAEAGEGAVAEVDEAAAGEAREAARDALPLEKHPLYLRVEEQLADREDEAALENVRALREIYPEEEALRDLETRIQIKLSVPPRKSESEISEEARGGPSGCLRNVVVLLLVVAVVLAMVAGFVIAVQEIFGPPFEEAQMQAELRALNNEGMALLDSGDLAGAREKFEQLREKDPDYEGLAEVFERLAEEEAFRAEYDRADQAADEAWDRLEAAAEQDDVQVLEQAIQGVEEALVLLDAIVGKRPLYAGGRLAERAAEMRARIDLERRWIRTEDLWQAQDWQGVITLLEALRRDAPDFRTGAVEQWLFEAYRIVAEQELETAAAQGDVDALKQAIVYLEKALELFPRQPDLRDELDRAEGYIAGAEAFAEEDWVEAVEAWDPIYTFDNDYLAGVLEDRIAQAYPRAAMALIGDADGTIADLEQAVYYLDAAEAIAPLDAGLVVERDRAAAYVAGAEAYAEQRWNTAIDYLGPIYAERPDYQGDALESLLREACAATDTPETDPAATWCPPPP
jgi:hypothetical protein